MLGMVGIGWKPNSIISFKTVHQIIIWFSKNLIWCAQRFDLLGDQTNLGEINVCVCGLFIQFYTLLPIVTLRPSEPATEHRTIAIAVIYTVSSVNIRNICYICFFWECNLNCSHFCVPDPTPACVDETVHNWFTLPKKYAPGENIMKHIWKERNVNSTYDVCIYLYLSM